MVGCHDWAGAGYGGEFEEAVGQRMRVVILVVRWWAGDRPMPGKVGLSALLPTFGPLEPLPT